MENGKFENQKSNSHNGEPIKLATFKRSDTEELRMCLMEYKGHPYVNFSLWRQDDKGDLRPVPEKTMSIRRREADRCIAGLQQAFGPEAEEEPLPPDS
jgi:hypothetical protein